MSCWDEWVEQALSRLESMKILRSLRPINYPYHPFEIDPKPDHAFEVFDGIRQWDRASVEIEIAESTFQRWVQDVPSSGDELTCGIGVSEVAPCPKPFRKLLLFSGNDYLGLSSHPTVAKAAAKAVQEHGMGPRGSALICGYTIYHRLLESCLAESKNKEVLACSFINQCLSFFGFVTDCLLCPTGFSANMAFMTVVGYVGSLSTVNETPSEVGVAIFSDALNHASIIDGIRLAERQGRLQVFIYRHCDMTHLNGLLSNCTAKKKVVVTDSLFSMDGDFAPMIQLSKLRKKHNFLLVVDDAHGTLVCGKNGGGVPEEFNCASDIDICIGTLSKAVGCHGGFIACSKRWKQLIQSRGRAFIFSTSTPIPIVAAAHAAMMVGKKETWRRKAIWKRVQDFRALTGIPIASPIISLIVGCEEQALQASRHMLKCGFHITAIRPPTVPANLCRLRITLSAAHTRNDMRKLAYALSQCMSLRESGTSKL
ncbi:Aminotransferase, class I/classII [Cynara cardunculus var. scolymus]|uniref:Aminotransferase, class I/classII n=1 Tax=Cynara cardunculus var. scolymus TaxID=59895 RepID=A0A103XTG3_CYNCS|nr:Aminotransferase, class I/classII [Cynara cardunculus var. scolymus]